MNGNRFPPKHPFAKLDYQFDWAAKSNNTGLTNWLEDGETILTHEVEVPDGIVLESSVLTNENTSVVAWLSGGLNNEDYEITCKITTATRADAKTVILPVKDL